MAIAPQGSSTRPGRTAVPHAETINENIEHVRRKIRLADLGRGLLAAGCLLLGYALVVAVFDLSLGGSDAWVPLGIRLLAFVGMIAGLLVLLTRVGSRFLLGVNPHYAARRLEETIPDSKNSVINWLDLKDQPLPPVIHQAVGARAARDVQKADPDLVGSKGELAKLGACAAVLLVGLVVLFAIVPRQFGSLMGRAFLPIHSTSLAQATTITVVKPAADAVVPLGQRVDFVARIEGRVAAVNTPEAPALFYRHTTSDAAVRVPMEQDHLDQWFVRLNPDQVRTGLYWQIKAGDAQTPEAQLKVRAAPFITRFEATYSYRPYRKLADETVVMPNELMPQPRLFGHRGTAVTLKTRANTPVKSGSLEIESQGVKKLLPAELNPAEPDLLTFRLDLDRPGAFRVLFDSADGEKNLDRSPYTIDVLDDGVPMVELYKPGKDLVAPPGGTLLLEGAAVDDFGVTGFTLKMTLSEKAGDKAIDLADQPYRPKTPIQFKNGTYPVALTYLDVVELEHLRTAKNRLIDLRTGNEIHYWLEATDNNDFGRPNVGKSRVYKVTIEEGLKPSMKEERKQALAQKEKHDKQQADEHNKQDQKNESGGGAGNQNNSGAGDGKDEKKGDTGNGANNSGNQGNNPDPKNSEPKNPDNNPGGNGNGGAGDAKDNPKNNPKQENQKGPDKGGDGPGQGGDSAADRQAKEDKAKLDDLRSKLDKTGRDINDALNKEKSPPKSGDDSPPQPGTKNNDPKANEKDAKDPKSDMKDPAGSGGASENGGKKDPKGSSTGAGGTPGSEKNAKTPEASADPTQKGDGKDKVEDGKGKATTKQDPNAEKGKGNVSDNAKTVKADTKPQTPNPGQAKGNEGKSPDGEPKAASKDKSDATPPQAKGKDGKTESDPKTGQKENGKDGKLDATQTKGDGNEKKGPPTQDEIDALKDALKKSSPEADQAAKDLAERGQDMQDAKLKKNLEDVLKEFGRDQDLKQLQGKGPELAPMPKEGANDIGQAPKEGPNDKQGTEASPFTNTGGRGLGDDGKRLTPEEMFARRMGSLQLENLDDLKKRVTPKVLDAAKVTDAEWQRFLDNARQYQDLIKKMQTRDEARFLRGGAGQMKAQGPRSLENNGATRDPLTGGQSIAPPEFQDAERAFTRKK